MLGFCGLSKPLQYGSGSGASQSSVGEWETRKRQHVRRSLKVCAGAEQIPMRRRFNACQKHTFSFCRGSTGVHVCFNPLSYSRTGNAHYFLAYTECRMVTRLAHTYNILQYVCVLRDLSNTPIRSVKSSQTLTLLQVSPPKWPKHDWRRLNLFAEFPKLIVFDLAKTNSVGPKSLYLIDHAMKRGTCICPPPHNKFQC